jgi:hypothetical protein
LKRLKDHVRHVWLNFQGDNGLILHQENAPSHTALLLCEFLACSSITVMDHPPYLLYSSLQFFLVSKVQVCAAWQHLRDVATITAESTSLLKGLKEDNFQGCFNQWKWRWDKCIVSEGDKNDVPNNT